MYRESAKPLPVVCVHATGCEAHPNCEHACLAQELHDVLMEGLYSTARGPGAVGYVKEKDPMTTKNQIEVDGVTFDRELARLEKPAEMRDNEHGGVMIVLEFRLEGGSHQAYCPSFSLKHKNDLACAAHFFWCLKRFSKGATLYVLRVAGSHGDFIRGIQDPFEEDAFLTEREVRKIEVLK